MKKFNLVSIVIELKSCIERLCEGGLDSVDEIYRLRDGVKGKPPCFVIQEYAYPRRWSCFNVSTLIIVPERETKHRAVQTPGELVHSKPSFVALTFPGYTVVRHSNANLLPSPLQLPVATALQGLSAQHLLPVVKPVRVVGDRRRTLEVRGFSGVFREAELRVGCVWIQSEICPV